MAGAKHAGRIVAITTAAAVILAACSSGSKGGAGSGHAGKARSAVTTTDADWKPVADALGRSGKLGDNNTAYRINLPRNDLHITSYEWTSNRGCRWAGTRHSPDTTTTKRC